MISPQAAINARGLRIPDDVAVVGFDNILDISEGLWPQLTTIQLPHFEMGRFAVEDLFSSKPGHHVPIHHKVDCPLVIRAST
ncbi:MAG: substrate-binding domain-containing protein [Chloroflexi bacterium]|nr:substrate-binding domain-containing protein [Chloroflexota bacterium]